MVRSRKYMILLQLRDLLKQHLEINCPRSKSKKSKIKINNKKNNIKIPTKRMQIKSNDNL